MERLHWMWHSHHWNENQTVQAKFLNKTSIFLKSLVLKERTGIDGSTSSLLDPGIGFIFSFLRLTRISRRFDPHHHDLGYVQLSDTINYGQVRLVYKTINRTSKHQLRPTLQNMADPKLGIVYRGPCTRGVPNFQPVWLFFKLDPWALKL
ncbi:hypothetical protein WICPIJ_004562 [Wickerhamomyces pijperi]|uniref:Uncharacterized protein n=1 Tax=Wickerhamomyces pijperi TaxID=599730 RepID=A0A9P8TLX9_WICPI|nr:hypothetical protein WICPIJ_004562 [Wickerhamomyces pijperi]